MSNLAVRLLPVPLFLAAWEAGCRMAESTYFPPPSLIAARARELWFSGPATRLFLTDAAIENFVPSLGRMFGGWLLACFAGIVAGVAIGRSATLSAYLDPLIQFGRAIPPPALVPVFIVVFRDDLRMLLATIVIGVVWPVLLNAVDGARYVDRVQVDTARVFGLTRTQRLVRLVLPAAAPKIFAGLRLSLSLALVLLVVAEMTNGTINGIGYELVYMQQSFDMPGMWGIVALLAVLGLVLNLSFLLLERRTLSWHRLARRAV
ncbi:ABC transporter permease subunit [Microbispora sp. NPDC088329]|uniref:ABC transporter permease n=1 Tax=Microbispora sp. NPDC088329 TaxID=3154869 RepID=UPI0034273BBC